MDAVYEEALERLRQTLASVDPKDPTLVAKDEVLARYGPLFRPEGVARITVEEFASFLRFENNRHWGGLQRMTSTLTRDMEALRRGLALLVDEGEPLASRFTEAVQMVRGLGHGIATAILLVAYPDRYGVWNGRSEEALKLLKVWPSRPRGGTQGEAYEQINEVILRLRDGLGTDLWTLDLLFYKLVEAKGPPRPRDPQPSVRGLAKELLWSEERAARLLEVASRGKPLLFSGPPGTGKTFVARKLAETVASDHDYIEVVQFHPSYAYEDFIEGIRPRIGKEGGVRYEIVQGALKALCREAAEDPDGQYVLIIDEFNRANLPRVLGEVLYCVEYRGRDGAIRLPYSSEEFWIPNSILIIGTMNTADRSIAIVDAALRRRFLELRFDPDPDLLQRWWTERGDAGTGERAARKLKALNDELVRFLDGHRLVGHTYLMEPWIPTDGFEPVWEWQLRPILAEHLYARPEEVERLRDVFLNA